jgi:hypothetical protein
MACSLPLNPPLRLLPVPLIATMTGYWRWATQAHPTACAHLMLVTIARAIASSGTACNSAAQLHTQCTDVFCCIVHHHCVHSRTHSHTMTMVRSLSVCRGAHSENCDVCHLEWREVQRTYIPAPPISLNCETTSRGHVIQGASAGRRRLVSHLLFSMSTCLSVPCH